MATTMVGQNINVDSTLNKDVELEKVLSRQRRGDNGSVELLGREPRREVTSETARVVRRVVPCRIKSASEHKTTVSGGSTRAHVYGHILEGTVLNAA